jgi:hypothetical protein
VGLAPSELRHGMQHLSESLEELSITQENYGDPQHPTLDPGMIPSTDFQNLNKFEATEIILLGTSSIIRHLDAPYTEDQFRNFVSVFPPALEHLTTKHCDNAITEPVMYFLKGELPQSLKTVHVEFCEDFSILAFRYQRQRSPSNQEKLSIFS